MNHFKKYMSVAALFCFAAVQADNNNDCGVSPTFVARSQARYKVREDVAVVDQTNLYDQENWYGTFSVIPGYMQTFRASSIGNTLFGNSFANTALNNVNGVTNNNFNNNCNSNCNTSCNTDCGTRILVQGSQVTNRTAGAWLADNFYLDPNYSGSFSVSPKVKDFFIDFDYFMGLDQWVCGMYFRVYAPFVHTKWELNFCDSANTNTSVGYPAGYFAPTAQTAPLSSFSAYAAGLAPAFTSTSVTGDPLRFAKITNCAQTRNGLGDLRGELGWNFWQSDCWHVGLNIQAAAPTGSRRHAEFLFDAVVGNGHHWELGGGLTAHYMFWNDESESKNFGFYLDANFTHLFKAREQRTFDLRTKPNSRYMLAAQTTATAVNVGSATTASTAQFTGLYRPVANLTTFDINVSVGVQADVVAWFNYTSCNWSWDFGYNFYGRSKESFDCAVDSCNKCNNQPNICDPSQRNVWILKGDAREYGFNVTTGAPVALAASERTATICRGANAASTVTSISDPFYKGNAGVDNAQPAFSITPASALVIAPGSLVAVETSIQPLFVNCTDVDFARTRSITNMVFTHVSYNWDCECWNPYLGIGGFAEFGKNCGGCNTGCNTNNGCETTNVNCNTSCDNNGSSVDTSLSRWGIWLKTGVSFN